MNMATLLRTEDAIIISFDYGIKSYSTTYGPADKTSQKEKKKKRFCDRETLSYHTLIFSLTIINKNFTHSRLKH